MRAKAINDLRASKNPDPYPHKFQTTMSIPNFIETYAYLKRGETLQETEIALAGRVMVKRDNNKLLFYNLHGEVVTISSLLTAGLQSTNHSSTSILQI
jgi:lysyl-tRNA synthetase, class II